MLLKFIKSLPKGVKSSFRSGWKSFLESYIYHKLYVGLLLLTFITMVWMSQSTPISGDEFRYRIYSQRVRDYFATDGKDKLALKELGHDPVQYNTSTFDIALLYVEKWFSISSYMELRHMANAITGFLAILFTSLIAYRLWGAKSALLVVLFLILTPRFLGHSLNNHRDIPPVASFAFTFFILLRYYKEYPKIKVKTLLFLLIGLYATYSIRLAGGLLLSAFVGLFMVSYHFYKTNLKNLLLKKFIKQLSIISFSVILLSVFALGLSSLLWPFVLENPISSLIAVYKGSTNHPIYLNQLFEGKLVLSCYLPKYFTVKFMLITIPVFIFLGLLLYFVHVVYTRFKYFTFCHFSFLFSITFPLFYATYFIEIEYGGWRHYLIVYPFIVLMAVQGFSYFMQYKKKIIKYGILGMLGVLLFLPLRFSAMNHPYHYIYFNEFVGGLNKAYKEYESDYGCHGIYGGAKWIKKNVLPELKQQNKKITVATNAFHHLRYYLRKDTANFKVVYTRYFDRNNKAWDYAIYYLAYLPSIQLKNNYWPPKGTIYTDKVDGAPVGIILKNFSNEALKGYLAKENMELDMAIFHYKEFLKIDPKDVYSLNTIGLIYLTRGKYKKALHYLNKSLHYYPDNKSSLNAKGLIYLTHFKKYTQALHLFNKVISITGEYSYTEAYYYKAFTYYKMKKPNKALKVIDELFKLKKNHLLSDLLTADILFNYGKYKDAENFYANTIKINKTNLKAHVRLAYCYYFQNKVPELRKKLLELNNQNVDELQALYCRIYLKGGKLNKAKEIFDKLDLSKEYGPLLHVARAKYYIKLNKLKQAENDVRIAIKLDNNIAEAFQMLTEIKRLKSKNNKAK